MASRSLKRLPALPGAEADVAEVVCAGGVTVDVNNGVGSGVVDIPPLDIPDDGEGRFDLRLGSLPITHLYFSLLYRVFE